LGCRGWQINVNVSSTNDPATLDDPELREALKRCSPATYFAACKFRQTGDTTHLPAIIAGVVERYVERDLRVKLREGDTLRLREDLGLDSLTMMEIVMLAEEVLRISISNEELTHLKTLADVGQFFASKLREITQRPAALSRPSHERVTNSRPPLAADSATAAPAGGLAG
jgi:acyl carrier protein